MSEDQGVTDSPIRGHTLSTSTSSFEALDPHDPNLSQLANTMFSKTSEYLYGELTSTLDDYRLLENMNQSVITKYSDMKNLAINVKKSMNELNDKCTNHKATFLNLVHAFRESNLELKNRIQRTNVCDNSLVPLLQQIDHIEVSVIKLEQAAYKLDAYAKRLEAKFKNLEKR